MQNQSERDGSTTRPPCPPRNSSAEKSEPVVGRHRGNGGRQNEFLGGEGGRVQLPKACATEETLEANILQ